MYGNSLYNNNYNAMPSIYHNTQSSQSYIGPSKMAPNVYGPPQQQQMLDILNYWKLFHIEKLQNDLNIYQREVNNQVTQQSGLTNRLKYVQKFLASQQYDSNEKTNIQSVVEPFQTQLNQLGKRVHLSESLLNKLANFFTVLIDAKDETTNKKATGKKATKKEQNQLSSSLIEAANKILTSLQASTTASNSGSSYNNSNELNLDSLSYSQGLDLLTSFSNETDSTTNQRSKAPSSTSFEWPYDISKAVIPTNETTESIARKIRESLLINKISQKRFAESLLDMKQTNFSSLMSQPLSWHTLSKPYRDRFLIMHLWLNDPNRITRLDQLVTTKMLCNLSPKFKQSIAGRQNKQKQRVMLTKYQTDRLRSFFMQNPYPTSDQADLLARELGLSQKKVLNWFTNQRQANKRKF